MLVRYLSSPAWEESFASSQSTPQPLGDLTSQVYHTTQRLVKSQFSNHNEPLGTGRGPGITNSTDKRFTNLPF